MRLFVLLFALMFCFTNCSEEEQTPDVKPPENLEVSINLPEDNSGVVDVTATADNANFFRFYFENENDFIEQASGAVQYQYQETGDYLIRVQAHTTADVFISKEQQVSIDLGSLIGTTEGYTSPEQYTGYNLVWEDDFEGNELSSAWTYEIGTGSNGWGNNELQYYRRENTSLQEGFLIIEAREESFGNQDYTSSRIITQDQKEFQYGRVDIRAKLPKGQGIWPALWMLGANFDEVGWPACGEIDIMELVGGSGQDNEVHGTVHWDNSGQYANFGGSYTLPEGIFNDQFYVFSIIWNAQEIQWLVDNQLYHTIDITPSELSEFRQSFFFIFNVAVGGNWPGPPNATTSFPQRMIVDYIRVFQSN